MHEALRDEIVPLDAEDASLQHHVKGLQFVAIRPGQCPGL